MNSVTRAACTIVSRNYLPYARTLCRSFLDLHPDYKFYVLLVDEPGTSAGKEEDFELICASEIGIDNFRAIAFKYEILELNTAVKPSFLKYLMRERKVGQVLYLDPDIFVYSSLDFIFDHLTHHSIVLTPHIVDPRELPMPADSELLRSGSFNLGFIGVSNTSEGHEFLEWWEAHCLQLGYNDIRNGLFVDQKWINLATCLFPSTHVLRHIGCNVAYWNLRGRILSGQGRDIHVNRDTRLVFFHFSGIRIDGGPEISKHSRMNLESRPDVSEIFAAYRCLLEANGAKEKGGRAYAYGHFSNGELITKLARVAFSLNETDFNGEDPFDASCRFYQKAKKFHLLSSSDSSGRYNTGNYNKNDIRIRLIHRLFRIFLRVLGADMYTMLMKYLSYVSVLRNQQDVFKDFRATRQGGHQERQAPSQSI